MFTNSGVDIVSNWELYS